jgi:hypothetical protein
MLGEVLSPRTLNFTWPQLLTTAACLCLLCGFAACNQQPATDETPAASPSEQVDSEKESRVLRHAVFFKFKDTSSDEDVQQVVEAFRALPTKIPEIKALQSGINNSPEGLDDGFTHCFLLTFANEAGRQAYLPHPEHKAFGDVLRPHMDKVFVLDYWGNPSKEASAPELKHAVFFKFKEDASEEAVKSIEEGFAALPEKIDTIKDFEWGENNSPESHDAGFTHCFMVTFESEEGRATYLPHSAHQAFVKELQPVLDKVRVLDFWGS